MRHITRRDFLTATATAATAIGMAGCSGSGGKGGSSGSGSGEDLSRVASQDLIDAAKKDGALVVYGSCEEQHLARCCEHFQELFGIKTDFKRLSTGEVE